MPPRVTRSTRDQSRTGFTSILEALLEALPGAAGAVLVDDLGECVDYAGVLESFELCVAAAHAQIELRQVAQCLDSHVGVVHSISMCARRRSYVVCNMVDNYVLIVVYIAAAPLVIKSRALAQAAYDIRIEAGWDVSSSLEPTVEGWMRLQVQARPHDKWVPQRVFINDKWQRVVVLGTAMDLDEGEKGFRVRTETGRELTLVREITGCWFCDMRL